MINQIIIINYDNYYRVSGDSHPADYCVSGDSHPADYSVFQETATQLMVEDFTLFRQIEQTEFVDWIFDLNSK